jgi:hypothetical protein
MPETFTIGFSEDAFVAAVAGELATPGVTPLAAASRCFSGSLLDSLTRTMGQRLITDPAVSKGTWPARYETLADLAATGAEAWYPELRFATRAGDAVDNAVVESSGFLLEPIIYGFGVERFYQLKVRRLKTQANHELRLNHVVFPAALFARVAQTEGRATAVPALHRQSGAAGFRPQDRYLPARLPHGGIRPGRHSAVLRMRPVGPRSDASRGDRPRR